MNVTRVLLADDHALVRAGIRALLEKIPNVEVIGEANSGREALEMIKSKMPNLVLMDIAMSELGGLEALPRITKDFPGVNVIILSAHANEEYVIRALRSGAVGYMLKDAATAELELAIRSVGEEKTYLSPSISRTVINDYLQRVGGPISPLEQLTPRQREILQLVASCRGALNGLMAELIEGHVRFHVLNPSQKTLPSHLEAADELMAVVKRYLN